MWQMSSVFSHESAQRKLIGVSSDKPINTSVAQGDATCV